LPRDKAATVFGGVAAEHGISLLVGYPESAPEGLYNAAMLVDSGGRVLLDYRKMHLWGDYESALFRPGSPCALVELRPGLRVGILICFDLDFPEPAQDLAARGADLILVPSATTAPYHIVPRSLVPARAYENAVFIAFCNQAGSSGGAPFIGESALAAPDGTVLVATGDDRPGFVTGSIDPAAFSAYKLQHSYAPLLRHDLFRPRQTETRP
jgi:predicted amidohydrolase